jgi:hypothetical protein
MGPILLDVGVSVPGDLNDLAAFRRWAVSDAYPSRGSFSFLHGAVWVDLTPEDLFTHNQVKTRIATALDTRVDAEDLEYFWSSGLRLSNIEADLSTEPDAVFVSPEAVRGGRVELVPGLDGGFVELLGTPMVLEVVSNRSLERDVVVLRVPLAPGIREYWLVDARGKIRNSTSARGYASGDGGRVVGCDRRSLGVRSTCH